MACGGPSSREADASCWILRCAQNDTKRGQPLIPVMLSVAKHPVSFVSASRELSPPVIQRKLFVYFVCFVVIHLFSR